MKLYPHNHHHHHNDSDNKKLAFWVGRLSSSFPRYLERREKRKERRGRKEGKQKRFGREANQALPLPWHQLSHGSLSLSRPFHFFLPPFLLSPLLNFLSSLHINVSFACSMAGLSTTLHHTPSSSLFPRCLVSSCCYRLHHGRWGWVDDIRSFIDYFVRWPVCLAGWLTGYSG
jgi:hypothetical protein